MNMRSLTTSEPELRATLIKIINNEDLSYNKVLSGNFVGLYSLCSWLNIKVRENNTLEEFELNKIRTHFLIKVKKILSKLKFPNFIVVNAMYFLDLVHKYIENQDNLAESEQYPQFYKSPEDNLFLNFVVCLMVANKSLNDYAMKSKYWTRLTRIPVHQLNQLEISLLTNILKHNPLVLSFKYNKLASFSDHLQSKIIPFNAYIEDFNARFASTYQIPQEPKKVIAPSPKMSSPIPTYQSSYKTPEVESESEVSPASSYEISPSSVSSISPNSSSSSVYELNNGSYQSIPRSYGLGKYIQSSSTEFKKTSYGDELYQTRIESSYA